MILCLTIFLKIKEMDIFVHKKMDTQESIHLLYTDFIYLIPLTAFAKRETFLEAVFL